MLVFFSFFWEDQNNITAPGHNAIVVCVLTSFSSSTFENKKFVYIRIAEISSATVQRQAHRNGHDSSGLNVLTHIKLIYCPFLQISYGQDWILQH